MDRTKLGARLHKLICLPHHPASFSVSQKSQFIFTTYPTDPVVPIAYEYLFFRVTVRELQAHALDATGDSDIFMSAVLSKQLAVTLHQRKTSLQIRIADASVCSWTHFVCLRTHIGTLYACNVFTVCWNFTSVHVKSKPPEVRLEACVLFSKIKDGRQRL